ncbi:MAG: prephenate dehydratase/arogenate dehydratase [Pseudolabrys sp.]|jgi:cyclohexadienyl dehydratase|nr:prephenate dehydratase/arogenate dehydratase [Pseudolabrys sp.]
MLRLFKLAAVAAIVSLAFAAAASAQTTGSRLDQILSKGTLRVGMTGDYRPFTFFNKDTSKFEGFDVDMAEALGKALGVKVEFVKTSWPTMTKDFQADKFDIVTGGVSITLERMKHGLFSTPIMREGKTPIARCGDVSKYQTLEQIDKPDVRVVVNPGGTNEKFARDHLKNAKITVYKDNVTIFDQIAKGDVDLMMTDASETRFQQKLHPGVLCSVHPDHPFDFSEKGIWMQRDEALKDFVDEWLHIMRETGGYKTVFAKYFN